MKSSSTCAISVFSKTCIPLPKPVNYLFNDNKNNLCSKISIQPSFDKKIMINNTIDKHKMIMPM